MKFHPSKRAAIAALGVLAALPSCASDAPTGSVSSGGSAAPALGGSGGSATAAGSGGSIASGGLAPAGGSLAQTGGTAASGGSSASGGVTGGGRSGDGGSGGALGGASTGGALGGAGIAAGGGNNARGGSNGAGASAMGGTAGSSSGGASKGGSASAGAAGASGTANVKLWIAGDSTVQNCSSACPCGWGGQFDALFNDKVTVQNSAVGGRSVQTWLYDAAVTSTLGTNDECTLSSQSYNARWTAMLNATSGMKAGDYLFIQFGINDGDRTCPRHVGLSLFKSLHGAMAQAAKERGAQPIFLTPVSAIECSGNKAVGTRGEFVTAAKEAGVTYGVPVIDLHQLSVDLYTSLGLCPNDKNYDAGTVGAFFCKDHTHFESAGAVQIAKLVAKALRDQNIPLAAYVK